jgi:undecaprenyl-diphosphatase
MLSLEHIIILAIVQGLTEFLPISSSGHLNLVHLMTGLPDQGVLIDAAVHVGSLFAVLVYFRADVLALVGGFVKHVSGAPNPSGRLALYLAAGTLPLMVVGAVMLKTNIISDIRTVQVIAWANILFAVVLLVADRMGPTERTMSSTTLKDALIVGSSQILALIPGASRAGVTMTLARALGYRRTEAAKLSMMFSIPAILAVGAGAGLELYQADQLAANGDTAVAVIFSFVASFASIWFMMALLERVSLLPFVVYRFALGAVMLVWIYGPGGV